MPQLDLTEQRADPHESIDNKFKEYPVVTTMQQGSCSNEKSSHKNDALDSHQLFGWKPDNTLSDDENYMDLIMILTRSSTCLQGSMACLLVQPKNQDRECFSNNNHPENNSNCHQNYCDVVLLSDMRSCIIAAATNQPLYSEMDSDVHAEIAALGQAARHGRSTQSCTAYITMPPCARCFAALTVSGVTRIVTRRVTFHASIRKVAMERNIEMVDLSSTEGQRQQRVQQLFAAAATTTTNDGMQEIEERLQQTTMILERRKQRKNEKQKKKQGTGR